MSEIKHPEEIEVTSIDPNSSVNVRRLGIDENVEKVKASIAQHGYWAEHPIVVRPHPDSTSTYEFQHVTGQCRLKACLALGLERIPAVVLELNDDDAIQRSWSENEAKGDLSFADKAFWTEKIYKRFRDEGRSGEEALEVAAAFLAVTTNTVREYFRLSVLPDEVMTMVNQGLITSKQAQTIVTNTYDVSHAAESEQKMIDRAAWLQRHDNEGRKFAVEALNNLKHSATTDELGEYVREKVKESAREIQIIIPEDLHNELLKWGNQRGLIDTPTMISHMIADTLRKSQDDG